MWTTEVFKMEKHLVVERIIAKINHLTARILITRQPEDIKVNLALGGKKEYIQSDYSNNVLIISVTSDGFSSVLRFGFL